MNYKIFIINIMLLIPLLGARAQQNAETVSGEVHDESGPLAGVIVSARSKDGARLSYAISDKNGTFSVQVPANCTSMDFQLLGYGKHTEQAPFRSPVSIVLEASSTELSSATVSTSRVTMHGDTLQYYAQAMRDKSDRSLGDLLEHLPGIQVSADGYVKFNGKPINRLYINGKNILDANYNLATRNLSPDAVKAIEVYQNHQPIQALRNVIDSRNAALNIVLEEGHTNNWTFALKAEGGAGDDGLIPYAASGSAIMIGDTGASVTAAGADASGHPYTDDNSGYITAIDNFERYELKHYFGDLTGTAMGNDRFGENHSYNFQSDYRHSGQNGTDIGTDIQLYRNRTGSSSETKVTYSCSDFGTYEIRRIEDDSYRLRASVDVSSNKEKRYFRDNLSFSMAAGNGTSDISGWQELGQDTGLKSMDISNYMTLTAGNGGRNAFTVRNLTQYSLDTDDLAINSPDAGQHIRTGIIYDKLSTNLTATLHNKWRLNVSPYISVLYRETESSSCNAPELDGTYPWDNDFSFLKITPSVRVTGSYKDNGTESGIYGEIRNNSFIFNSGSMQDESIWLSRYGAFLKLTPGKFEIDLTGALSEKETDDGDLGEGLIFTDYNTLWRGRTCPGKSRNAEASLAVSYKNPLEGLYIRTDAGFSHNNSFMTGRDFVNDYIINYQTGEITSYDAVNASFNISKGFYTFNTKLDLSVGYRNLRSSIRQDSMDYDYRSGQYNCLFTCTISPFWWWINTFRVSANTALWSIGDSSSKEFTYNGHGLLNSKFMLTGNISLDISGDYSASGADSYSDLFFIDASLTWELKKDLELHLKCNNLLNKKEYTNYMIYPMQTVAATCYLRPINALAGIEVKF